MKPTTATAVPAAAATPAAFNSTAGLAEAQLPGAAGFSPVYFMVYSSVATREFSEPELRDLVVTSRARNVSTGVRGLLLHHERSFMQLLEGPEPAVRTLYSRIRADARHRRVRVLVEGHSPRPHISGWGLALRQGTALADGALGLVNDSVGFPWEADDFPSDTPVAPCLRAFRRVAWWGPV